MRYQTLNEAMQKLPFKREEVEELIRLFENEIPAGYAIPMIRDILTDDNLFDELRYMARTAPDQDARPVISEWVRINAPGIITDHQTTQTKSAPGMFSPVHGYGNDMSQKS